MPRRSIWKGCFVDAFLLRKCFFLNSPTPDEFEASGAFFEYFFFVAPLSLTLKGEGGGFLVVVIANSFHFFFEDSFPVPAAEKPQAPPPLTHTHLLI
jgi:hypothetical protein